ncbi:hypothetical protein MMC25_003782 [Agyrium rufum]|nr:hypothetical protein [Agyrium rufum]
MDDQKCVSFASMGEQKLVAEAHSELLDDKHDDPLHAYETQSVFSILRTHCFTRKIFWVWAATVTFVYSQLACLTLDYCLPGARFYILPISPVAYPHYEEHFLKALPNTTLAPYTFAPLPLGSISPQGWLLDQLELMANGLAGNQYDFYNYVNDSTWLGGTSEYSDLNEGFPYWFNGLVPLAYSLNDDRLKAQVLDSLAYVFAHQQADGWLGPEKNVTTRDFWGRFPFCLGLMQLMQADSTQTATILPPLYKFISLMQTSLEQDIEFSQIWGQSRYADMILVLQWLYETYPEGNEDLLLNTMNLLKQRGIDWADYFTEENYLFADLDTLDTTTTTNAFGFVHGVNAGQGLKNCAVDYRFTKNETLLQSARNGVNWTFAYHGAASGTIIGDERESGLAPYRGSELCTAVESMYSLSYLYQTMGDNSFAQQSELIAYNALPVMFTPDQWAHQYIAQPNQPWSRQVNGPAVFWNVNDFGQTFGLEPNYPCCTVNHPQGYPKFLSSSFVRSGSNGLAHALLAPANVSTVLPSGALVSINCDTQYPFGLQIVYTIKSSAAFEFSIRIPEWSTMTNITVTPNGPSPSARDAATGMVAISLPAGAASITVDLGASIKVVPRANSTIAIYHGALLYALDVGETSQTQSPDLAQMRPAGEAKYPPPSYQSGGPMHAASGQHRHHSHRRGFAGSAQPIPAEAHDYIINNTLPWNIAIDPLTLVFHDSLPATNSSISSPAQGRILRSTTSSAQSAVLPQQVWAYRAPPSYITAKGCQIDWPLDNGVPGQVPLPGSWNCTGAMMDVVLRPYGSLRVHMAELPTVELS